MKNFIFLLLIFVTFNSNAQFKTYYSGKYVKLTDAQAVIKSLNDTIKVLRELKFKPNIYMPVLYADSTDTYKWNGAYSQIPMTSNKAYVIIINPDTVDINFKYYSKYAIANIRPKKVKISLLKMTSNKSDPWEASKGNYEVKMDGNYLFINIPKKSFALIDIKKK